MVVKVLNLIELKGGEVVARFTVVSAVLMLRGGSSVQIRLPGMVATTVVDGVSDDKGIPLCVDLVDGDYLYVTSSAETRNPEGVVVHSVRGELYQSDGSSRSVFLAHCGSWDGARWEFVKFVEEEAHG